MPGGSLAAVGRTGLDMTRDAIADVVFLLDVDNTLLAAMQAVLGDRLTTVFPRQGHYALDPANARLYPAPDLTVEHVGDLVDMDAATLVARPRVASRAGPQPK